MQRTLSVLTLTILLVGALDIMFATALQWANENKRLGSLVQYFEYGRSVPGKLEQWVNNPGAPGNLYDVAWRSEVIANSQQAFLAEDASQAPVIRSYGMSFVNNIIRNAVEINPDLVWDGHGGPGAPPNYTFALFEEDREARRSGDIVVFGILSSSVPGMAALSNSTWVFEQPAPFTYPVYWPDGSGLRRVEPMINSSMEQRSLSHEALSAWERQLSEEDYFYSLETFGMVWLDQSPFARLVRRSFATSTIQRTQASIISGSYPYSETLQTMVREFARVAREDEQIPIVMLIQSRDPADPRVLDVVMPVLQQHSIPYFATEEYFDPRDVSGFMGDGHYIPDVDRQFGQYFSNLVDSLR